MEIVEEQKSPTRFHSFSHINFPAGTMFRYEGNVFVVARWRPGYDCADVLLVSNCNSAANFVPQTMLCNSDRIYENVEPLSLTYRVIP